MTSECDFYLTEERRKTERETTRGKCFRFNENNDKGNRHTICFSGKSIREAVLNRSFRLVVVVFYLLEK